ncbi:hypothetical protein IE077_002221 [Cardiosporidium cionae]|uniref:Uncharacterized protein n=1 Tax=Cardiosporidium cionae TaxID=476202 RepID=A0ABQ7JFU8_9APIC|nr:hypothetical protein IE077_002221 [Cardiosporidium cionae]|eukprot:KAF8822886.1 hypothetical protein IE077_002221 [Cardiosporidium cionae]
MFSGHSKRGKGPSYQHVEDGSDTSSQGDIPPLDEPAMELSRNAHEAGTDRITPLRRVSLLLRNRDEASAPHSNTTFRFPLSTEPVDMTLSGNNSIEMASLSNIHERGNTFLRGDIPASSNRHAFVNNGNSDDRIENTHEITLESTDTEDREVGSGLFHRIFRLPSWLGGRRQQPQYVLVPTSVQRESVELVPASSSTEPPITAVAATAETAVAVPAATTGAASNIVEESDNNSDEDDPFCHQTLFLFGVCCGIPLLWVLGALLWLVTPKQYYRSRAWGLVNVFLAVIFIIYWVTGFFFFSEPPMEDITIFSQLEHIREEEDTFSNPGYIKLLDRDRETSWTLLNTSYVDNLADWSRLSILSYKSTGGPINQDLCKLKITSDHTAAGKLSEKSAPIRWKAPFCGLMSPIMHLSGRIQFLTTFRNENTLGTPVDRSLGSDNSHRNIEKSSVDVSLKNSHHSACSFPNEISADQLFITDEKFPKNFTGGGLRCMNPPDDVARWLLHWKNEKDLSNPLSATLSTTVINFPSGYVCSFATLSTRESTELKNAWQSTDVETLVLRGLP